MGDCALIFEIDSKLYGQIKHSGLVKDIAHYKGLGGAATVESFETVPWAICGFFISHDCRLEIGAGHVTDPQPTGRYFVPSHVLGYRINSGDLYELEQRLPKGFDVIEKYIPDIRDRLKFQGSTSTDSGGYCLLQGLTDRVHAILAERKQAAQSLCNVLLNIAIQKPAYDESGRAVSD